MSGHELDDNQGVLNGSSPSAEFDPHSTDMHTAREDIPLDPRHIEDPPAPIQNTLCLIQVQKSTLLMNNFLEN